MYEFCGSYGFAIILFTLLSKIVLLPISLWTYMNSITRIKIQPDINFLKVKYYGQKDTIAEEQAKLFKEKKYHPLTSTILLIIQRRHPWIIKVYHIVRHETRVHCYAGGNPVQ